MLVSTEKKIVFFAIPKTGTRSIYNLLSSEPFNGVNIGDHKHKLPNKYNNYTKFTVVRNPYDRMFSIYWSCCRKSGDMKGFVSEMAQLGYENNFNDFMRWVLRFKEKFYGINQSNYMMLKSQSVFFENDMDYVLRAENLDYMFSNLPFIEKNFKIPHLNKSNYNSSEKNNTSFAGETIEMINEYCHNEFDLLGYERKNP